MITILYLVRHGRTSLNSKGCFRGNVDIPLSTVGKKDVEEAADFLESIEADPVFIGTSDKKRAVETSDILAGRFNIPVEQTHLLRALNVGKFSGQPRSDENVKELETYLADPETVIPDGESLQDFRERVVPTLEECFQLAASNGVGIVTCHSSIVHEAGTQLFGSHTSLLVEPGGVVAIGLLDGQPHAEAIFKKLKPVQGADTIS